MNVQADFFGELSAAVRQMSAALASVGLNGRFTIGLHDRRNAERVRAVGAAAIRAGLAMKDPARRLDPRVLMMVNNVEFRDLYSDHPSRALVVRGEEALEFFGRGVAHSSEKQGHLDALSAALVALADSAGGE